MKRLLLAGVLVLTVVSTADALTRARFRKVFIVVLENTAYGDALAQPFLAGLAARGALFTNFFAEGRPSLPNYIALTAGRTYGITSNADVTLDVSHVGVGRKTAQSVSSNVDGALGGLGAHARQVLARLALHGRP